MIDRFVTGNEAETRMPVYSACSAGPIDSVFRGLQPAPPSHK
jgi:hypothetical protein